MKRYLLIAIALVYCGGYAQTLDPQAPTLQLGLDQLSFTKGTLDAELIMEIVAEKQKELKMKAIQNVFLKKVEHSGGTVYCFTNNIVKELLLEKDTKIRTKKIMENTVNLVFTVSFLDYYLTHLDEEQLADFNALSVDMGGEGNYELGKVSLKSFLKNIGRKKDNDSQETELQNNEEYETRMLALLIDMASETVRNDEKLHQLGLMQISYSDTYEYMNRYKNPDVFYPCDSVSNRCDSLKARASAVYANLENRLSKVTNAIGLVNYIVEHFSFRNDKLAVFSRTKLSEKAKDMVTPRNDIEGITIPTIKTDIEALKDDLRSLIEERMASVQDTVVKKEVNNLVTIHYYLNKVAKQLSDTDKDAEVMADVLYTFYNEFIPLLKSQSYGSIKYLDIIDSLDKSCAKIASILIDKNSSMAGIDGKVENFFLLAAKLYEFDKATTISEYLKLVDHIGSIFPDEDIRDALSTIVSFIKDYTVTEELSNGKEVLTFNVESFIARLQRIKPHKLKRWNFHFTVGINNAYFGNDLTLKDNSVVQNLSFVSEKIGIKYKLKDWAFYRTRNPGETYQYGRHTYVKKATPSEPLVSNWHLMAYGSGILYNVVNAKTNSEFDFPLAGFGTGLTFSNALDLNLTVGVPLISSATAKQMFDHSFVGIGFDIQFIEYYDRLQEKRQAAKTQKLLAEAQGRKTD